jgi:hypothetical protein
MVQQFCFVGDVGGDPAGLVAGEQLGRRTSKRARPANARHSVRLSSFCASTIYACVSPSRTGVGMGKPFAVCALCVISAALGAAIDRYLAGAIEQGGPHLERAVSPKAAVAAPAEMNDEVLGDRVRCDVRYQELKIPATAYHSFKRKCVGDKWDGD